MARAGDGGPGSVVVATTALHPSPEGAYRQTDRESCCLPRSGQASLSGGGVADDRSGAVSCALACHASDVAGCVAIHRQEPVAHAALRHCPVLVN